MAALRKVQDLELLALACRRASKRKEEGRAQFSLGVMWDNLGQYQKAIESYSQFLRVCTECEDAQGCGLAYHCIGVDYQLLAGGAVGGGSGLPDSLDRCKSSENRETKAEMLRKAISFHNTHREGADSVGKFVAHLNNGLAYALLGEKEHSTVSHQYALRYALELHSLEGQSLAIGSLGFSEGMYCHDPGKMSVLIERYLELCGALKQPRNQASALQKLGTLASQRGDSEQGACYFRQAMQHAREQGDLETALDCGVQFGVAHGLARMDDHLGEIHEKLFRQRA
jgi:tetratricopeptide (TPR) repeat protein